MPAPPASAASLRRPPLVEAISERLLKEHRRTEWLPPERTLAAQLGVSRSALRESIKRLENQGLLESRHGIGVRVVHNPHAPLRAALMRELPKTAERIRQFADVRVLVEPEIARLAADHATAADHANLRRCQQRLHQAIDLDEAVQADLEFHRRLAAAAGNRVLALMLASIAGLEEQARRVTLQRVGLEDAHAQHEAVLAAIIARDPSAAQAAMRAHVQAVLAASSPTPRPARLSRPTS